MGGPGIFGETGVGSVVVVHVVVHVGPRFGRSAIGTHHADKRTPTRGRLGTHHLTGGQADRRTLQAGGRFVLSDSINAAR